MPIVSATADQPTAAPRAAALRGPAALAGVLADDRDDVARRVGAPRDVGPHAARDAPLVLVEAVVPLEPHALPDELVDRRGHVTDEEVQDREDRGLVVILLVDEH